jgi:hypothetical protein
MGGDTDAGTGKISSARRIRSPQEHRFKDDESKGKMMASEYGRADYEREIRRWTSIAAAWMVFYAFVFLHGLSTPIGFTHGSSVSSTIHGEMTAGAACITAFELPSCP